MNHLINIILISLFCVGWCRLLRPEMLLENIGYFIERYLGKFWSKPFGLCVPCSASVIGTVAYLVIIYIIKSQYNFFEHIFYCIITVGLNMIFWFATENMVLLLQIRKKQLEQMNKLSNQCSNANCNKPKPIIKKTISKDFTEL